MNELERAMTRQYKYQHRGHRRKEHEKEFAKLQEWAEKWILKQNGKLTVSAENEIKQILDKLHESKLE